MTPWTVAYQASPCMGFSRQEYWSGLPFPSPRDLPDPGIEPGSPALQADALPSEPPGKSPDNEEKKKKGDLQGMQPLKDWLYITEKCGPLASACHEKSLSSGVICSM